MPTEPPPEPPTKLKTPPPKPNRSPPTPKATTDGGTEPPLPKRGPAPPKPVRVSPPIPRSTKSSQDQESGSSPTSYGSRGILLSLLLTLPSLSNTCTRLFLYA